MEGERQPWVAASAAESKVLDDDNLLIEILLRVSLPTTLVCTALVCKRWLQHVSDPKFLHRFCKLHPPSLLGFYIIDRPLSQISHFVPMLPQPQGLAHVIRRASFSSDTKHIFDCRNGRVLTACHVQRPGHVGIELALGVHSLLCPERGMAIETPPGRHQAQDGYEYKHRAIFSKEERGIVSYLHVSIGCDTERTKSMVHVHMLHHGDGTWRKHLTLATDQFLRVRLEPRAVLVNNKIYMAGSLSKRGIVVLDLVASSISTIQLPQGVEYVLGTIVFSPEDYSSGLFLVHAKDLQLRIWLHKGDNWLQVDTICLREMCAKLRVSDCMIEDGNTAGLWISQVGDNAEFVFLQMGRFMLYLDVKCRTLRKVYEMTNGGRCSSYDLYPCKMIWPPTFPPLAQG